VEDQALIECQCMSNLSDSDHIFIVLVIVLVFQSSKK